LALPLSAIKAYEAYLVKDIFDKGFSAGASSDEAWKLAAILVGLGVLNYPLRFFHYYGLRMIVDRCSCSIRSQLFRKFQVMPASYFATTKQGNMVSTFMSDTHMFADAFKNALEIIREPITAIGLVGVAIYHDWQLALVILVASPIFALIFNKLGRRIRKYIGLAQGDVADMTHAVSESLAGQKITKAFGLQDFLLARFERLQARFIENRSRSNAAEEHSHPAVELVGSIAFAGVIGFVGIVVPHLLRLIIGPGHPRLLPASACAGAILLLAADTCARTIAAPAEIPIGVLTAIVGAPFFLVILLRQRSLVGL
jgi:subfamily B ATP-binding cassette protein MsbA